MLVENIKKNIYQISKSERVKNNFRVILLFVAIILSGGMLIFPRPFLLVILLGLIFALTRGKGLILKRTVPVWLLMATIFFITLFRPGPIDLESLIIRYANFIPAIFLLNIYLSSKSDAIQSDLMKIMPWIGWQAIVTFLLSNSVPFLFSKVNLEGFQLNTIFFIFNYHDLLLDYEGFKRPNGFFFEPGVLQIYLNIYLYLSLFVYKSFKHISISTVAILCTLSTTGMLIASILYLAIITTEQKNNKNRLFFLILMISAAVVVISYSYENIQNKLFGSGQGSTIAREYDFFSGINVVKENPLLGIGFDHNRYINLLPHVSYINTLLSDESAHTRSTSNGIIYLFYSIGIPLGLIFCVGIYRQKFFPNKNIFFIIIFLSLLGESLIYTPFFLLITFSGLIKLNNQINIKKVRHDSIY